jgi:hypothetical protein
VAGPGVRGEWQLVGGIKIKAFPSALAIVLGKICLKDNLVSLFFLKGKKL